MGAAATDCATGRQETTRSTPPPNYACLGMATPARFAIDDNVSRGTHSLPDQPKHRPTLSIANGLPMRANRFISAPMTAPGARLDAQLRSWTVGHTRPRRPFRTPSISIPNTDGGEDQHESVLDRIKIDSTTRSLDPNFIRIYTLPGSIHRLDGSTQSTDNRSPRAQLSRLDIIRPTRLHVHGPPKFRPVSSASNSPRTPGCLTERYTSREMSGWRHPRMRSLGSTAPASRSETQCFT